MLTLIWLFRNLAESAQQNQRQQKYCTGWGHESVIYYIYHYEHTLWDPGFLGHCPSSAFSAFFFLQVFSKHNTSSQLFLWWRQNSKLRCLGKKRFFLRGVCHTPHICYACASVKLLLWTHLLRISFLLLSIMHPDGHLWNPFRPSAMCIFSELHRSHDFAPAFRGYALSTMLHVILYAFPAFSSSSIFLDSTVRF